MDRRQLLANLGAVSCFALPYQAQAQYLRKKVKITDVKVMIVRGPTWDWNLFKIETDAGVHGIGETIAISVNAAQAAVADIDGYLELLDAAL